MTLARRLALAIFLTTALADLVLAVLIFTTVPETSSAIIRVLVAVAVTIAGATAATFLVARSLKPIIELIRSANRLASGDLQHRAEVKTEDEIGELSRAFNNMAERLQSLYSDLENKVEQKTVRLEMRARQAEEEAAKDAAVLTSIGEGLVAVNSDGRVTRINQPALDTFGLTIDRALGKKISEITTLNDENGKPVPADQQPPEATLRRGERVDSIYQVVRPDASKLAINIIVNPILLKDHPSGAILVVRDVTKEREIDRMKTEFISLASHQLRTPLSSIKWFTEMLLAGDAGKLKTEQDKFAHNIYASTERMIELVNSLLNISRIESGRIIVEPEPTDLASLLQGIVNDLHAKIKEKKHHLIISVHDGLPKVNLDPRLIAQVYLNFLTNAIKYTPTGGEITVFVSRKGDELVSQISDNGYGIPASQQARMFEKFFRGENVVKFETEGTGLGMYLVKAIIESSGGKVWFKSEENKGTTFWFSLPMSGMKPHEGEVTLDM